MPLVPLADIHLNVCVEGRGPPLLLVHGFPLDHSMWSAQIAHFSASRTVIAPDLRGFGMSDVTPGAVAMSRFADDLAELLDEVGVSEPVTLCGLSMGGYIAFQFFRRHRSRLEALVLCDTRAAADDPSAQARRIETADRALQEGTEFLAETMIDRLYAPSTISDRPDLIAAAREVIRRAPRAGVAAASRGMAARPDVYPLLPEIDVPTLVVGGAHDPISPPAEMRGFAGNIPHARFVELKDAGHMSPQEQPAAFNAELASFLAER